MLNFSSLEKLNTITNDRVDFFSNNVSNNVSFDILNIHTVTKEEEMRMDIICLKYLHLKRRKSLK